MSTKFKKIPIPPGIRKKASIAVSHALKNMKYGSGINQLEKYRKSYSFDDKLLYALGLIYDHRGMQISGHLYSQKPRVSPQRKKKSDYCFGMAGKIFHDILSRDPKNTNALFRLGVLFELKKRYKQALKFKLKAYRIGTKDKEKRIPLLIGFTYLKMGKKREAEKWIKRELELLGKEEVSANLNILLFFFLTKEYKKALPYALKAEKLLKSQRKTMGGKIQALWRKRIQKTKSMANR